MKVLVVNAGSSSLKYQLFDTNSGSVLAKGNCERIGIDGSRIIHKTCGKDEYVKETPLSDHSAATKLVVETLLYPAVGCIGSVAEYYDANPPFAPRGAVSQAWSVGGLLYIKQLIEQYKAKAKRATKRTVAKKSVKK